MYIDQVSRIMWRGIYINLSSIKDIEEGYIFLYIYIYIDQESRITRKDILRRILIIQTLVPG